MKEEQLQAFLAKVAASPDLQEKLRSALVAAEAILEIAKEEGLVTEGSILSYPSDSDDMSESEIEGSSVSLRQAPGNSTRSSCRQGCNT
jgi:predicted ribosomally synthesized peptide with nif11-like leader